MPVDRRQHRQFLRRTMRHQHRLPLFGRLTPQSLARHGSVR
jgi:hypothetical protein